MSAAQNAGPSCQTRKLARFLHAEEGSYTIFAVVGFAFLVAFIGLVVDVGRIMNIHSQAASYVDRAALAAASELDRGYVTDANNALTRAVAAAQGADAMIDPGFRFSLSGDTAIGISRLTFLESISDDPFDPFMRSPVSGDVVTAVWENGAITVDGSFANLEAAAKNTNFVLAETTTETEEFVLFPIGAFLVPGIQDEASVRPQALAGFKRELCNFPPLAICNPYETSTNKSFTPIIGQEIAMKTGGANSAWAPGNFGFLAVPGGAGEPDCKSPPTKQGETQGAAFLRCVLALVNPNTRCVSADVDFRPGQANTVHTGINVRFDIWDPPLQNKKNDVAFAPAANVTKGKVQGNCTEKQLSDANAAVDTDPLPRDRCFVTGNCSSSAGARFGNGITDVERTAYWQKNHGVALPAALSGATRYEMYRYEIDNNLIPDKSGPPAPFGEDGNPSCSNNSYDNDKRDRRVLIAAVVNCQQYNVQGAKDDVPVEEFVEVFMTRYISSKDVDGNDITDDQRELYGEVLGVVKANTDSGILKEYPVLYR